MALRADDVDLGRDRDLVARFQNGDRDAFDDLYRRYFDRLRRFCRRHTGDGHEAEEVAQDAFVRALRSLDRLEGERRFYPWLTVIAKRIIVDRHRKQAPIELTDAPDVGAVDPDHDHLYAAIDAAHVHAALDKVGPRHREVLLLRETQAMSYADIATTLDVPVTTVEALLHRARKALRREYAAVTDAGRRGLWGLPVLGWLRARADERWAELVALGAPVAVAAVTAAVVLVPNGGPDVTEVDTADRSAAVAVVQTTAPSAAPTTATTTTPAPSTTTATDTPRPTAPATVPVAPTVDAGPVDVYVGAAGTEAARTRAEEMPVHGTIGETTGGVDPPAVVDDVAAVVDDVVEVVFGRVQEGNP